MAKKSKILDALMKAFKAKDADEVERLAEKVEDEFEGQEEEKEGGDTHVHVHLNGNKEKTESVDSYDEDGKEEGRAKFTDDDIQEHMDKNAAEHAEMFSRIEELEKLVAKMAGGTEDDEEEMTEQMEDEFPEEMKESAAKAKDSAYLADSFRDTVALAEILVPGIRVPTFDRSAKKGSTFKQICNLRRTALDLAYGQPDTRSMIDDLLGGKRLDTKSMTCDAARTLFRSAAAMKRNANNGSNRHSFMDGVVNTAPLSLSELNKLNAAHWAGRK